MLWILVDHLSCQKSYLLRSRQSLGTMFARAQTPQISVGRSVVHSLFLHCQLTMWSHHSILHRCITNCYIVLHCVLIFFQNMTTLTISINLWVVTIIDQIYTFFLPVVKVSDFFFLTSEGDACTNFNSSIGSSQCPDWPRPTFPGCRSTLLPRSNMTLKFLLVHNIQFSSSKTSSIFSSKS